MGWEFEKENGKLVLVLTVMSVDDDGAWVSGERRLGDQPRFTCERQSSMSEDGNEG